MEIKEFIDNFAAQLDDTEANVFTAETKFKEIAEWSSLSALSIMAMVDEEYDVEINGQDIRNCETIADLFYLVSGRK